MSLIDKLRKRTSLTADEAVAKREAQQAKVKAIQEQTRQRSPLANKLKLNRVGLAAVEEAVKKTEAEALQEEAEEQHNSPDTATKDTVTITQHVNKSGVTLDMLNDKQREAVKLGSTQNSFCLIGGAGTGKTTTQRLLIEEAQNSGAIGVQSGGTDRTLTEGAPSVVITSFTNKAVNNIRAILPNQLKQHCVTMHTLLEYAPEYIDVDEVDEYGSKTGNVISSKRFVPTYGVDADGHGGQMTLPAIDLVIVEESGSVPLELFNTLLKALPPEHPTKFIFLGDLNQLPPVFGDGILGYGLLDMPIVELTEVYRQALLSPITNLAVTIQKGRGINDRTLESMAGDAGEHGKLEVFPFKQAANELTGDPDRVERMTKAFGQKLYDMIVRGDIDFDTDVLLVPFNKMLGTIELNRWAGQALRDMYDLTTYHVKAGFEDKFLCVGDRVLYDKMECRIVSIEENKKYMGQQVLEPSKHMNRWGYSTSTDTLKQKTYSIDDIENSLDIEVDTSTDKVNQASHVIGLCLDSSDDRTTAVFEANTASQVNSMLPLNVMTVHKSQGSEWRKVVLLLHTSHATMWNREIIYTAVTRARECLTIFYSGESKKRLNASAFQRGVIRSNFKGNTLAHKLDYFKVKREAAKLTNKASRAQAQILNHVLGDFAPHVDDWRSTMTKEASNG